jgi:hypothetical protein
MLEDLLTFIGYMLPACLVISFVGIGLTFYTRWASRITRKSTNTMEAWLVAAQESNQLLRELIAMQRETNRLLAQRSGPSDAQTSEG